MTDSTPTLYKDSQGTIRWTLNGGLHRADGPAIERADGSKEWWSNGRSHRTGGPAVEEADGTKEWWIKGNEISVPYTYVLTAAFTRGIPIPEEAMLEMAQATSQAQVGEQIGTLKIILHKYWPTDVKKILATLFNDSDPDIKHIAFSLLGREAQQESAVVQCAPLVKT